MIWFYDHISAESFCTYHHKVDPIQPCQILWLHNLSVSWIGCAPVCIELNYSQHFVSYTYPHLITSKSFVTQFINHMNRGTVCMAADWVESTFISSNRQPQLWPTLKLHPYWMYFIFNFFLWKITLILKTCWIFKFCVLPATLKTIPSLLHFLKVGPTT